MRFYASQFKKEINEIKTTKYNITTKVLSIFKENVFTPIHVYNLEAQQL